MADIGLIYLTYNSAPFVRFLSATVDRAGADVDVVAVDNSSDDDSACRVRALGFEPVVLSTNIGFTAGINRALAIAAERGHRWEWVAIVNPDARPIQDRWIEFMCSVAGPVAAVGARLASGPRVLGGGCVLPKPRPIIRPHPVSIGGRVVEQSALLGWSRLSQYQGGPSDFLTAKEVPWVAFGAVVLRMDALEAVGPLAEEFWHFASDQEWCLRAWAMGRPVVFAPVSFVHAGGSSLRTADSCVSQRAAEDVKRWCLVERLYLKASGWDGGGD